MTVDKREPMKWSANLSFAAAAVTAASAIFSLSIVDGNVRRWVVVIAVPPILASLYQGVQYRRGESANAF